MLFDPSEFFITNVDVEKPELIAAFNIILAALGGLPESYLTHELGEVVALGDDGLGPAPSSLGTRPITFSSRDVHSYKPEEIELNASITLTDRLHLSRNLINFTTDSYLLTAEPHPDPTVGISHRFWCTLERYNSGGVIEVQSPLTNQHAQGHTRVANNGLALLKVDVIRGVWCLYGSTTAA